MPPAGTLRPGITVLGNLAVDRIGDAPPSAGGCPTFAAAALSAAGGYGRIVTRAASADLGLFADVLAPSAVETDLLPATSTSGFGLQYSGDGRSMTVDAIGPVWDPEDLDRAAVRTTWVHVSPLLRTDFPAASLAHLAAAGHRITYDGQGLVRKPVVGPLALDTAFDHALLSHLTVLKLADDEAAALVGGDFGDADARRLGVPEILVTAGSGGCTVYWEGASHAVPAAWRVEGVHSTGAGDMFAVSYGAARAAGDGPIQAAEAASRLVSEQLEIRRAQAQA